MSVLRCPKSNPNFRDKSWNVEENEILHEIFRVASRFRRYFSCHIAENRIPLRQYISIFLQTLICSSLINCKPNVIFLKMETLKEYTSGLFVPIKKYIYILILLPKPLISKLKQFSRKIVGKNTCPSTNRSCRNSQ